MLKIASIVEEGRFGGPQRWISAVSGRLKEYGGDPIVIFSSSDSEFFCEELCRQKIRYRRISLHRLTKEWKHLFWFFLLFVPETIMLCRILKKEKIAVVHCNNSWQFKGLIAGRLAGKKVVWHLHETSTHFLINLFFKFFAENFADAFIAAGERSQNYYLNNPGLSAKPIMQIQAPVDTSVFDPEKAEKCLTIANCPGLKIVTVGNINPMRLRKKI